MAASVSSSSVFRAANCEGINSLPFHLPLTESVNKVVKALDVHGVVLIKASPGSGKTSFITLLENHTDPRLGTVVSKSMLGRSANGWKEALNYSNWDEETTRKTILIDEVQILYPEDSADELWATFKRLTQKSHEQQQVRVVCFASYGEKAGHSSAGTPFDFPKRFGQELLRVDTAGVREWIDKFNQYVVKTYLAFPLELAESLWFMTRGHLGLVAKTMWSVFNKFEREIEEKKRLSLEMLAEYLTSESFCNLMAEFRANPPVDDRYLTPTWKEFLRRVLLEGGLPVSKTAIGGQKVVLGELITRGYLVITDKERIEITTPLLELILFNELYQTTQTATRDFATLEEFLLECLSQIPRDVLANTLGVGTDELPLERTWQMEFYRIAWSLLPKGTYLSADVGSVFGSTGQLDFYVNTQKKWGIELLREGRGISEHCHRFSSKGIYASIPVKEFVVIDFRSEDKGARLTHPNLWTVSYSDDFSCITLKREGKEPREIRLPERQESEAQALEKLFERMSVKSQEKFIAHYSPKRDTSNPPRSSGGGGRQLLLSDSDEGPTRSTQSDPQEVTIRRLGKTRGGILIEMPKSIEELKKVGSDKFRVMIVGVRGPPPTESLLEDIKFVRSGSVVYLTTEEEEKEF